MVGYQVLAGGELEKPLLPARELLERGPLEQTLAGELLNLIGRERAPRYDPAMLLPGGLWPRAQEQLLHLASTGRAPPGLMQSQWLKSQRSTAAAIARCKAARLVTPACAVNPQITLFSVASTCGACPIRAKLASSSKLTSRR